MTGDYTEICKMVSLTYPGMIIREKIRAMPDAVPFIWGQDSVEQWSGGVFLISIGVVSLTATRRNRSNRDFRYSVRLS